MLARFRGIIVVVVLGCIVLSTSACDAGVFFGENCTEELAEAHDPACVAWPQGANATSAYSVLEWKKGGIGFGGRDDLGGDVFLSTTLNLGCGGGYFGSQFHWNSSAMNLDWAVWDIGLPPEQCKDSKPCSTMNTHPVNPVNSDGKPTNHQGELCSTKEPPPKGLVGCPCSRYSGEGFGVHCGIGESDGFLWEIGTPYTLNITLDPSVPNNASAATFAFTIRNEHSKQVIDVGKILTTNPSGTHGIAADKYVCNQMPVGGGSFQEYYDGGNFTSVAAISGPIFRGVEGYTKGDVQPTAMTDCTFFGNCSGGYGGCHNETTTHCVPKDGCPSGYKGLATQTFLGGEGQEVAEEWIPPWYNWAAQPSVDDSAGPDGGVLPPSDSCDFHYNTDQAGGCALCGEAKRWGIPIMKDPANPAGAAQCDNSTSGMPGGICARSCCAHCLKDTGCVFARLRGDQCWLMHEDPTKPLGKRVNSTGLVVIVPHR